MLLECPRCLHVKEGDFGEHNPPGTCPCGSYQYWRVIKARRPAGFVRVLSDKGWQDLHPPDYREKPDAWKNNPPRKSS